MSCQKNILKKCLMFLPFCVSSSILLLNLLCFMWLWHPMSNAVLCKAGVTISALILLPFVNVTTLTLSVLLFGIYHLYVCTSYWFNGREQWWDKLQGTERSDKGDKGFFILINYMLTHTVKKILLSLKYEAIQSEYNELWSQRYNTKEWLDCHPQSEAYLLEMTLKVILE